jgi:glycerophosphoryl diester phosphodiesterase
VNSSLDIQGHRGARGLIPENTIPGFIKAIDLGVNTLEMDLSVTSDSVLILSHDPYFSSEFCLDTTGTRIEEENRTNIYQLTYEEITKYDCGSILHQRFPQQLKISVSKPRLSDVIDTVESYLKEKNLPLVNFNIELKTTLETDNVFHPTPEIFSDLVFEELTKKGILGRTIIQSFDFRTLQYFKRNYPEVELALLIENNLAWEENIDSLGFIPEVYSCEYELLSPLVIQELKKLGIAVIPWTVNDANSMQELIDWGVDGIITDYPDKAIELINLYDE